MHLWGEVYVTCRDMGRSEAEGDRKEVRWKKHTSIHAHTQEQTHVTHTH